MEVQSVVFKKNMTSKKQQRKWLQDHGYKDTFKDKPIPDENKTQVRYRQTDPKKYKLFQSKWINPKIMLVLGRK